MTYEPGDEVDIACPCCHRRPAFVTDYHPNDDFYTLECATCTYEFDVYEDIL
jgi:hypothetical protein